MSNLFSIRLALEDDLSILNQMISCDDVDWSAKTLQDCFSDGYFVWVVADKARAVAFVVVKNNYYAWEILQIVVDQHFKRNGFATQLLKHVIRVGRKQSIEKIELEVRISNNPAIFLYQKIGFIQVGVRKKYYTDGEDAILMDFML